MKKHLKLALLTAATVSMGGLLTGCEDGMEAARPLLSALGL